MATHRITLALADSDVEILTRLAKQSDRSLSSMVRALIRERAEDEGAPTAPKKSVKPKK